MLIKKLMIAIEDGGRKEFDDKIANVLSKK